MTVTGCAAYHLEPLSTSHPAHPEAPPAAERPPSQTLAYAPADIPTSRPVAPVTASPHDAHHATGETRTGSAVVGEGEVIATVPQSSQIVVDHGEIQGFMEAMTMGYQVDPPSLLVGLKPGDKVRFTIDVARRAIVNIERQP